MNANKNANTSSKTGSRVIWITLLVFLVAPHIISTPLMTEIMIFGLFALGFNLLLGHTGILSFGHAAYFGVGCYGCGMAVRYFGVSVWTGLLGKLDSGGDLGGHYRSPRHQKAGGLFCHDFHGGSPDVLFFGPVPFEEMDGGRGWIEIYPPSEPEISLFRGSAKSYSRSTISFISSSGVSILIIWRILNSPFGRLLQAIRENETRTIASGYNVTMAKFLSLVFSGTFSALAGGLFFVYLGYGPLQTLFWLTSGTILLMTILGGMHTFIGPVVGVAAFLYLQNKFSWIMEQWELVVGILFMILILIFPAGIVGTIKSKYLARKTVAQEVEEAE